MIYSYFRIVLRLPSILKRTSSGAKTCSSTTPTPSKYNNCKPNNNGAEFVWIGFKQPKQQQQPSDNLPPQATYSTIKSCTRSGKVTVSKKGWKKRFTTKKRTPLSALKVNNHLNDFNNNSNVETPPDFKIYDELPQTLASIADIRTPQPKIKPSATAAILSTPLPPIPARKPRHLFNNDNQHQYVELSPILDRRLKKSKQPKGNGPLLLPNILGPRRVAEPLYWEADFMYSSTLLV